MIKYLVTSSTFCITAVVLFYFASYKYSYTPIPASESKKPSLIMLLYFEIYFDSLAGHSLVELITKKELYGIGKFENYQARDTLLVINQINESQKVIRSHRIEHPLFKSMEYLSEEGKFKRAFVRQPRANFLVWIPVFMETTGFTVEEVYQNKTVSKQNFFR